MRVRVLFFGVLKDMVGRAEETVEVPPEATLGTVFEQYAERFATLRDRRSSILFARNREFATTDTALAEDDEVALLPPVSGGSGTKVQDEAGHYFAITREKIDSEALAHRLQRPEDGAVIVFEGVV